MKKLLLLATLFLGVLGGKAQDNGNISATLKVDSDNQNATLTVSLNPKTSLVAFQMDVQLPEGHAYTVKDGVITPGASLINNGTNSLGSTNFVIAHNFISDNVLRLVAYNLGNVAINVDEGAELFHVTFTANTALEGGATAWTATFDTEKTIFVTAADLEEIRLAIAGDNVIKGNVVPGEVAGLLADVNRDGVISIADVVSCLEIIALNDFDAPYQLPDYDHIAADVNRDNAISISDIVAILEIIANQ